MVMAVARVAAVVLVGLGLFRIANIGMGAQAPVVEVLEIEDHVAMPILGQPEGKTANESALSRINGIQEESGGSNRWFLPVVSGPVYVYDRKTKAFTTYLDLNGYGENRGLFKKFFLLTRYGNGLNRFALDPDYRRNRSSTTHLGRIKASDLPQNTMFPRLQVSGYATTTPVATPGP
jgi:hypothetical protein